MKNIKKDNLNKIIESSIILFSIKGYRQTRINEIANKIGVSSGFIYIYFEGKKALFDYLLRHIFLFDSNQTDFPELFLPNRMPQEGSTIELIRNKIKIEKCFPILYKSIIGTSCNDIRLNFENIIDEIYSVFNKYKNGILLLDRSHMDWPEFANFFFKDLKIDLIKYLSQYLKKLEQNNYLDKISEYSILARLIIETIAAYSIYKNRDPYLPYLEDSTSKSTVLYVINSLL